jgi:hypothetical protein
LKILQQLKGKEDTFCKQMTTLSENVEVDDINKIEGLEELKLRIKYIELQALREYIEIISSFKDDKCKINMFERFDVYRDKEYGDLIKNEIKHFLRYGPMFQKNIVQSEVFHDKIEEVKTQANETETCKKP